MKTVGTVRARLRAWKRWARVWLEAKPDDITHESTVLLGDSLMALAPGLIGIVGLANVVNWSVSGSTTADVLIRARRLARLKPRRVVIHAGVNDIQGRVRPWRTAVNYARAVGVLESAGVEVWVLPCFAVNVGIYETEIRRRRPDVARPDPDRVERLNGVIGGVGASVIPVPGMLDMFRRLPAQHTYDGLHLSAMGAQVLGRSLRCALKYRNVE